MRQGLWEYLYTVFRRVVRGDKLRLRDAGLESRPPKIPFLQCSDSTFIFFSLLFLPFLVDGARQTPKLKKWCGTSPNLYCGRGRTHIGHKNFVDERPRDAERFQKRHRQTVRVAEIDRGLWEAVSPPVKSDPSVPVHVFAKPVAPIAIKFLIKKKLRRGKKIIKTRKEQFFLILKNLIATVSYCIFISAKFKTSE